MDEMDTAQDDDDVDKARRKSNEAAISLSGYAREGYRYEVNNKEVQGRNTQVCKMQSVCQSARRAPQSKQVTHSEVEALTWEFTRPVGIIRLGVGSIKDKDSDCVLQIAIFHLVFLLSYIPKWKICILDCEDSAK